MLSTNSLSSTSNLWPSLHTLRLSHNKLGVAGDMGMASGGCGLAALVSMCKCLQELYVDACGLSSEVIGALVEPLKGELCMFQYSSFHTSCDVAPDLLHCESKVSLLVHELLRAPIPNFIFIGCEFLHHTIVGNHPTISCC